MTESCAKWFALQVQPSKEKMVATILANKGYRYFLPTWRPLKRDRKASVALFPGYLFCHFDLQCRQAPVVITAGFIRIVGFGRTPQPVPDWEIDNLRRITCTDTPWNVERVLHVGATVAIRRGPLAGVEGVFVRQHANDMVVVQISMLGGGASVIVDVDAVRPLEPSGTIGPCELAEFSCNEQVAACGV